MLVPQGQDPEDSSHYDGSEASHKSYDLEDPGAVPCDQAQINCWLGSRVEVGLSKEPPNDSMDFPNPSKDITTLPPVTGASFQQLVLVYHEHIAIHVG